jgi:diguanylate cyclase (GGDEF)-like protein/PAS domain S-box-containing protein
VRADHRESPNGSRHGALVSVTGRSAQSLPSAALDYPIAISSIYCDRSGRILKISEGARRLLGIMTKRVAGTDLADVAPWGLSERIPAILSEITAGFAVVAGSLEIVRDDNSLVTVNARATPVLNDGVVTGFTLSFESVGEEGLTVTEALPAPSEAVLERPRTSSGPGYWFCDFTERPTFYVDARAQRVLGLRSPGRVDVEEMDQRLSPTDRHRLFNALRKAVTSETSFALDGAIQLPTGARRAVHFAGVCVRTDAAAPIRLEGVVEDVTEDRLGREGMRRTSHLAIELFEHSPVPAKTADPDGRITLVNDAFLDMLGYLRTEFVGKTFQEITHPADRDLDAVLFREVLAGTRDQYEIAKRYRRADGTYVGGRLWVAPIRDESGNVVTMLGQFFDETALDTARQEIEYLNLYDAMTSLPKLQLVSERILHELKWARVGEYQLGVVVLDLDRFVTVNATYGAENSDFVLAELGRRLVARLRTTDVAGRLDGDAFIVVRSQIDDPAELAALADEIVALFRQPFAIGEDRVLLSASFGLTLSAPDSTPENLMSDARLALERAKGAGGGRWVVFDDSLRVKAQIRASVTHRIQNALERNELAVYYQPVADLDSGAFVGVEALVRWLDPERGLTLPEDFIATAEESGLIIPIGEFVLTQACKDTVTWCRELGLPNLRCAVNVSPVQLQNDSFVASAARIFEATGCDPHRITFEITESSVMEESDSGRGRVDALHELGVRVSIDDFGTGYSSLGRIRHLALDELKIDRSFTAALLKSEADRNLVLAIIEMGRALRVDVVAEGVETTDELHWLRGHRCHLAQGYLFSRPLPERECGERLQLGWWPLADEGAAGQLHGVHAEFSGLS